MPTLNHRLPESTDAHSKVGAAEKQLHRLKQSEPNMEQYSSRKVKSSTYPVEVRILLTGSDCKNTFSAHTPDQCPE